MYSMFARFDSCGEVRIAVIGGMFYRRTNGRRLFGGAEALIGSASGASWKVSLILIKLIYIFQLSSSVGFSANRYIFHG